MTEELGKIEKPSASNFEGGRKLYFVPLIFAPEEAEDDYKVLVNKYWDQVQSQVTGLEIRLGDIHKIYHEFIPIEGNEGLKIAQELMSGAYSIMQDRMNRGAQLQIIEDKEMVTEFMDWSKCLAVGLQSTKVWKIAYDAYMEIQKKRNEYILKQIDDTLKENEIGLLLMREGHQLQFPSNIQILYVAPPTLDEIKRWLRARADELQKEGNVP